jgi:hypothetical protein
MMSWIISKNGKRLVKEWSMALKTIEHQGLKKAMGLRIP